MHSACIKIFLLGKLVCWHGAGPGPGPGENGIIGIELVFLFPWHVDTFQYVCNMQRQFHFLSLLRLDDFYNTMIMLCVPLSTNMHTGSWKLKAGMEMQSELDQNFHVYIRSRAQRLLPPEAAAEASFVYSNCWQTFICHHINNNTFTDTKAKYLLNGKW